MNVSKRVLCFLLFIFALLLSSCNPYGAVKSTKKEREILATLGAEYDVPYELFRYGYLGQKKLTPDGSFSSLSQSAMREAADVYATFALAKEYGIDPYSKAADKAVEDMVKEAVEGSSSYSGYGSFEAYLEGIRSVYMNDSVARLYFRYNYCQKELAKVWRRSLSEEMLEKDITAYYNSDECIRVTFVYVPYEAGLSQNALHIIEMQAESAPDEEKFVEIARERYQPLYSAEMLGIGFYLSRYSLDRYYQGIIDAAFSLEIGETSPLIETGDGYYIVRRLEKDEAYLTDPDNREDLREYYLNAAFYRMLSEKAETLSAQAVYTDAYTALRDEDITAP